MQKKLSIKLLELNLKAIFFFSLIIVIIFEQVFKSYQVDKRQIEALKPLNLHIKAGQIFGIIGHSGAGKSTLLRMINRLENPSGGKIWIDGVEICALNNQQMRQMRRKIGMIFQHFNLLSNKTVFENVALPLKLSKTLNKTQTQHKVNELLTKVGLQDHANHYPAQLSGGQKQRVGIARALTTDPQILLCDEATSALDPQTTKQVLQLLAQINAELKLTIVLITHEMGIIRRICDEVCVLENGAVVESGIVADVFLHPKHEVTKRLVLEDEHIDENEQLSDFANIDGKIVRLTFKGAATYEPFLQQTMNDANVSYSILMGRIDRIKDLPYGQLTLALSGKNISDALNKFEQTNIQVEILR